MVADELAADGLLQIKLLDALQLLALDQAQAHHHQQPHPGQLGQLIDGRRDGLSVVGVHYGQLSVGNVDGLGQQLVIQRRGLRSSHPLAAERVRLHPGHGGGAVVQDDVQPVPAVPHCIE